MKQTAKKQNDWVDATTYGQNEKERVPRIWYLKLGNVIVRVHRHIDYPERWMMQSQRLDINLRLLLSTDINQAKIEALDFALQRTQSIAGHRTLINDALKREK